MLKERGEASLEQNVELEYMFDIQFNPDYDILPKVDNVLEKEEALLEQNLKLENIFNIESNPYGDVSPEVTIFARKSKRS